MSYVTRYEYNESKTIVTVSKYNRKIIETEAKSNLKYITGYLHGLVKIAGVKFIL